jgi:tetratricopeptide (TPR) repeat protein
VSTAEADPATRAAVAADPAVLAAEAVRLASVDSHRALRLTEAARAGLRTRPDDRAALLVERALGLVSTERGRMPEAVRHLRRAVRLAEAAGEPVLAAEVRLDLSEALLLHGRPDSGLAEAERARAALTGPAAARSLMRCALILQRRGRYEEALDGYRQALAHLRRAGDREYEARALCNRGILHAFRGALGAAEADLRRAEGLHSGLGRPLSVAHIHHNLAFVAARRGDAPRALALYDATDEVYRRLGSNRGILQLDRCEVLVSVNLVREARDAAEDAVAELARAHLDADLPEARVVLSQAALLDGDPATARDQARLAQRAFTRQRRGAWAALARHAAVRAAWAADDGRRPGLLTAAQSAAAELAVHGWPYEALDARIIAGRVALARGRHEVAARELRLASAARHRGPVRLRIAAWHAEALLRLSQGNERGAQAAVAAGVRVVDAHRASLGATELRAQATAHAAELSALGIRLAVASRSARRVLQAAEQCRSSTWLPRPPLPPEDPATARDFADLRRIAGEIRDTALAGGDPAPLLHRQSQLEAAVRRRAHHARGAAPTNGVAANGAAGPAARGAAPNVAALATALGERVLVEFVEVDGRLHAVTLRDGHARLWDLGALDAPRRELATLSFALGRLAEGDASEGMLRAHGASAAAAVRRLDALLFAPLRRTLDGRRLVIVPTAALHTTPWAALPSCAGRPLSVARSATLWRRCATGSEGSVGDALLVAGPGLPEAEAEIEDLRARYPHATCLTGAQATTAAVTAGLARAELAHIAAHGTFRSDNALFSALELADGPLTVYDLEAAGRVPRRLVLSACDSGRDSVLAGDELMGLTSTLFTLGTRTVVGSVAPVRDDQTRALMVALHRRLRAGEPPADALAAAQTEVAAGFGTGFPSSSAFVCFGAG